MIQLDQLFQQIPDGLKIPLLEEFNTLHQNFLERRWRPAELSAGRFCEIVFCIIKGYENSNYPSSPNKPRNFVKACRQLENKTSLPRSFRILIPRLLPSLYEVRNNRNVGHVGGEVDPSYMDSSFVISNVNWIIAELVRVLHNLDTEKAQRTVDKIIDLKTPLVWVAGDVKRLLDPSLSIENSSLMLLHSENRPITLDTLQNWLDYNNEAYLKKKLRKLHNERKIEFNESNNSLLILPPGKKVVEEIIKENYT